MLREAVLAAEAEQGEHLLVYQTAAGSETLVRALHETGLPCRLYGVRRDLTEDLVDGELVYRPFSETGFLDDLRTARGVIAGGGFSLLSECVYLHKPALSLPVAGQFEQTLNARYLERARLRRVRGGADAGGDRRLPRAPARLRARARRLRAGRQPRGARGAARATRAGRAGARRPRRSRAARLAAVRRPPARARHTRSGAVRVTLAVAAPLLCVLALVMALVEIEIEGPYGWAEKLPTPYRVSGPVARLFGLVLGGKPLTGYNLLMFAATLVAFHLPFAFGAPWTAARELAAARRLDRLERALGLPLVPAEPGLRLAPLPAGLRLVARRWLWRLPLDYWVAVAASLVLALAAQIVAWGEPPRAAGDAGPRAAGGAGAAPRRLRRPGRCSPAALAALRPAVRAHARGRLRRARPRAHHPAAGRPRLCPAGLGLIVAAPAALPRPPSPPSARAQPLERLAQPGLVRLGLLAQGVDDGGDLGRVAVVHDEDLRFDQRVLELLGHAEGLLQREARDRRELREVLQPGGVGLHVGEIVVAVVHEGGQVAAPLRQRAQQARRGRARRAPARSTGRRPPGYSAA